MIIVFVHCFRHQLLDGGDAPSALCPQGGPLHHHHGDSRPPLLLRGGWRRGNGRRLHQQNSAGVRRRRQRGQLLLRPDDCHCGGTARCYLKRVSQRWILTPWLYMKLFQHPHTCLYYLYSCRLSFFSLVNQSFSSFYYVLKVFFFIIILVLENEHVRCIFWAFIEYRSQMFSCIFHAVNHRIKGATF